MDKPPVGPPRPINLVGQQIVQLPIFGKRIGRHPPVEGRLAVWLVREPRDEDQDVFAVAPFRSLAHRIKQPAQAVGGGFQDDLGIVGIGHRLQCARHVVAGFFPKRNFRAVEILNGIRTPDALGAGGANPVAGIKHPEKQLLAVRLPSLRLNQARAVVVESLRHGEQIVGRILLVGQDECLSPPIVAGLPVEPPLDQGRATWLPCF